MARNEGNEMYNIVIPMAGAGSRFAKVGYSVPKPLIPVGGVPMIRLVIENIRPARPHRFIFICRKAHIEEHGLDQHLRAWAEGCEIVTVDDLTEGAACTVLAARHLIDSDAPLMIANCDQYIDADIDAYLDAMTADGLIMTMTASDPKWSYARTDAEGYVDLVVEKQVISDQATVGIYNFARGDMFVEAADRMIAADFRVNGEFYVAPVYNFAIEQGKKIDLFPIGSDADGMYGLGTPEDYTAFCEGPMLAQAVRGIE